MTIRLLLLSLLLFSGWAWADPEFKNPVEVRWAKLGDGWGIYARNILGNDMAVTVEFTNNENIASNPPLPHSKTVPGGQEILFAQLRRANPNKRWAFNYNYFWNYGNIEARHDDSVVYQLPYQSGDSYKIIQGFHGAFSHTGDDEFALDFGMPEGTPILACRGGTVAHVEQRYTKGGPTDYHRNRVNVIRIRHDDNTIGEYDHLRHQGAVVAAGEVVQAGQLIGYSGNTGFSTGPHLHFVVYRARDGRKRQSYPIRFHVAGSYQPVEPQQGETYIAP